jgi:hypothetical protein
MRTVEKSKGRNEWLEWPPRLRGTENSRNMGGRLPGEREQA